MKSLILLAEAITKDGGLSADYVLAGVIAVVGVLIAVIFGFILSQINSIKEDVKAIRNDFHAFTLTQAGINSELKQKTKDL